MGRSRSEARRASFAQGDLKVMIVTEHEPEPNPNNACSPKRRIDTLQKCLFFMVIFGGCIAVPFVWGFETRKAHMVSLPSALVIKNCEAAVSSASRRCLFHLVVW